MIYDMIISLRFPLNLPLKYLSTIIAGLLPNHMTHITLKENTEVGIEVIRLDDDHYACRAAYYDGADEWSITNGIQDVLDTLEWVLEQHKIQEDYK
jgi:hypothetical protein